MRLGFHYHIPAYKVDGKIYTMAFQGLFIDSLAVHCSKITLFLYTPTSKEFKELDYQIVSDNVQLVSLMKHYMIPVRILLFPFIRKLFREMTKYVDIMLIRGPTPILPLIVKEIKDKIPYSYLVVGEMSLHVDSIKQKEWRKSLIRRYVNWNEGKQEYYAKDALVFANSAVTYEKYKSLSKQCVQIRTTTLSKEDFYIKEDTCLTKPFKILFTGRIEQDKGILDIAEAIGKLNNENIDCSLDVVGWALPNDNTETLTMDIGKRYGIGHKIVFHGFKQVGPELFKFYKEADIFIVASQNNEGFPRTIWEALAHSVPVIAVPVGSISSFLTDNHDALFINRKDPEDIMIKIKRIITDKNLRQNLIKNGLETVKEVTLEIQSKKMTDALKEYLQA